MLLALGLELIIIQEKKLLLIDMLTVLVMLYLHYKYFPKIKYIFLILLD